MTERPYDVLLLDFGGVCLLNPVELHTHYEDLLKLPRGTFTWMGPLDPSTDALFRESIGPDGITERDYWDIRAKEVGDAAGIELDMAGYVNLGFNPGGNHLIRPEAIATVELARALGMGMSILTNDLTAFHDEEWVASVDFITGADHLIDCSHIGFLKPDQRAYAWALEHLSDIDPSRILFVDDQPLNAEAAAASGMDWLWFDIADAAGSWAKVAERLQPMTVPFNAEILAEELRVSEETAIGVTRPTLRWPDFDWADARATAKARDAQRLAAGDVQVGYKLGWTSAAMRKALGIDQPNWGTLWASQQLDEQVSLDGLIHPKAEPEFIYVAGETLSGEVTEDDVVAACAGWTIGLELVDPRFPSYDNDWLDNTADNSSGRATRTGAVVPLGQIEGSPADFAMSFSDGTVTHQGTGDAAMGTPVAAIAWLVGKLAEEGLQLEAGHIVYTGGITAPFDLLPGNTYEIAAGQLGTVRLIT